MDMEDPAAQAPITLIDAHHHFWNLDENPYPWLSDHPEPHFFLGNYDALKRNYLVADYRRDSAAHRVIAIVLDAIAIFGIERCMFASNFPVAGLRVDYDTLVRSVARMVAGFSAHERHAFFVGNAASFYRLDIADQ